MYKLKMALKIGNILLRLFSNEGSNIDLVRISLKHMNQTFVSVQFLRNNQNMEH